MTRKNKERDKKLILLNVRLVTFFFSTQFKIIINKHLIQKEWKAKVLENLEKNADKHFL